MKVTIYSSPTCGKCMLAKKHMKSLGVDFEVRNVMEDDARNELLALGYASIPVVVVDGKVYADYNIKTMTDLFTGGNK